MLAPSEVLSPPPPPHAAIPRTGCVPSGGIEFFIPGQPVAKARARTSPIYRRDGSVVTAKNGRVVMSSYTPKKTENYENRVAAAAHKAMQGLPPLTVPVALEIEIGLEVPASWSAKKRLACYALNVGATKKPDMDNIEKAVIDGMNAIVFDDDARVVRKFTQKQYAERPGVTVRVRLLAMVSA